MFLATGAIGGALPEAVWLFGDANTTSPNASYTFSGTFGTETPKRRIAVIAQSTNNASSTVGNVGSLSVGGVAATKVYDPGSGSIINWTFWLTDTVANGGPTGASGNVVISRGASFTTFTGVQVFALYNLRSGTPISMAEDLSGDPASVSVDTQSRGVLIAMGRHFSSASGPAWTGSTQVDDRLGGVANAVRFGAAVTNSTAAATGLTVSLDNTTGGINSSLFVATFR